jgi:hypothetical protein
MISRPTQVAPFSIFAHLRAVHLCLIGRVLLRLPLGMAQPAQIGSKDLTQIHAPIEAVPLRY